MTGNLAHQGIARGALQRVFTLLAVASLLASALSVARVAPTTATETPTSPQSCGVRPIDLVVIVDRSGSMATQEGAKTRLAWAKEAVAGLVSNLNDNGGVGAAGIHRVGVSSFGGTTTTRNVALSAASDAATIATAVNAIGSNGGTPLDIGMNEGAANMAAGARATHNGVAVTHVLILLSDGNPDPDSYAPNATEIANFQNAAEKAYTVAIGVDGGNLGQGGTGVDYDLMESIADPGLFRYVTSGTGLPNLFEGIYEEIACPTGKLEVRKQLVPQNDPGRFDLWIDQSLKADEVGHNGTTGEQELIEGTYTVAETADGETSLANYSPSISCVDTAHQNAPVAATQGQGASWSVPVGGDTDVVCTITNTRHTGTLTVTKVVKNDDGGKAACSAFGFKVNGGGTIGFEADCTNVLTVPTGTYDVTEPTFGGYATSYAGCEDMVVSKDGNATCTITNDDQPGTLIVKKTLKTDDGGTASCDDFSFKVNGGSAIGFEADCQNDLIVDAGTYTVVETDANGYDSSYANCTSLQVANGGTATCVVTNDDQPGTLIVIKDVENRGGSDASCDDFSFAVNGGNPMSFEGDCKNVLTVDAGTYSVAEPHEQGFTTTYDNCSNLRIPNGGTETCTITNTRNTGMLEVVKDLSPSNDAGRFDLLVDGDVARADAGDGDGTGEIELATGTHTVGEGAGTGTSLGDYASSIECWAGGGEGQLVASASGSGPLQVNVTKGADILCVIHNTKVSVSIDKSSDHGDDAAVEPGETIHFELAVTVNVGTASNVVVTDTLPDGLTYVSSSADPSSGFDIDGQELTWTAGSLAAGTHTFAYDATVDADASGTLRNLGCVDADQNAELVCDETTSRVQRISVDKSNGTEGAVVPGTVVDFSLTLTVTNGPIAEVTVVDQLPDGLSDASDISDGGIYDATANTITWSLTDVADGTLLTYTAAVDAAAEAGEYVNVASITDGPCVVGGCEDDSTVTVRVPSLTVEKVADTESITITGPNDALVATPSVVTWTISWTLTDGPVTNAVITDEIPAGFTFLDASDGGTFADGTVTWTFPTLSSSGSVTLRTTVDPETISRAAPTVNVATIDSDETAPDEGQDSVMVGVIPPPEGGNPTPTPKPSMPNTAIESAPAGTPVSLPLQLLVAVLLASLASLTLATVRVRSRRR